MPNANEPSILIYFKKDQRKFPVVSNLLKTQIQKLLFLKKNKKEDILFWKAKLDIENIASQFKDQTQSYF